MKPQIFRTLLLITLIYGLPLLPKYRLLATWPVIVSLILAFILNTTHPPVQFRDMKEKTSRDQHSVLLIFLSGCLVFLVPILDYGYGRKAMPPIFSLWSIMGLALSVGGLSIRYWSIRTLGQFFTSMVQVRSDQEVIDRGPYRWTRHPSYLGSIVFAIGNSILFRSYAGLTVCFLAFFPAYIYRIWLEEHAMVDELGQKYRGYQKRTWKILPLIY